MPIFNPKLKIISAILGLAALVLGAQACTAPSTAGGPGLADKKLLVAVLEPSGNAGVTAMHKKSVRGGLEEYISGSETHKVLDRSRFDNILSKKQKQEGGLPDKKLVKKLKEKAGADFVCALDLYREGDHFNATCWLVDARTGEATTANDFIKKDTPLEVAYVIGTLAGRLLGADGQKLAQLKEGREAEEKLAESEEKALAAIERLRPNFDIDTKGGTTTYTNRALAQYAEQQRAAVLAKKADVGHALSVEIAQGRIVVLSKYAYRGEDNRLGHTKLSVTVNGQTATSPLVPTRTLESPGGMGVEEAELTDVGALRLIAANPTAQAKIQIENSDGFFKAFVLSPAVQRAAAQTMELLNALEALKEAEAKRK
jgi:hypothetical protein